MKMMSAVLLIVLLGCAKKPVVTRVSTAMATDIPAASATPTTPPTETPMPTDEPEAFAEITKENIHGLKELTTWWGLTAEDIASSRDGSIFVVAQFPDGIYFYDPATAVLNSRASGNAISEPRGGEIRRIAKNSGTNLLSISSDGAILATGSSSANSTNFLRLWDASNGDELWSQEIRGAIMQQLTLSPDGRFVALMSDDLPNYDNPKLRVWDVSNGSLVTDVKCPTVTALVFSGDGSSVITGDDDGSILFISIADGKLEKRLRGHTQLPISFLYAPDGKAFVTGSMDGTIFIWELPDYRPIRTIDIGNWPVGLVFLPENSILISTSGKALKFIDISTGEIIREIGTDFDNQEAVVIHGGRIIASRSFNQGSITFWGIPNG